MLLISESPAKPKYYQGILQLGSCSIVHSAVAVFCNSTVVVYGVALVRSQMGEMEDRILKASGSMKKIRAAAAEDEDLLDACKLSVQPVKDLLHKRFQKLDSKGDKFRVFQAASQEDLVEMLSFALVVDAQLPQGAAGLDLKSKVLHKQAAFNRFIKSHFSVRDYFVVIGKHCQSWDSGAKSFSKKFQCNCKAVKMDGEHWADLSTRDHLLPDPEPMGGKWLQYHELALLRKTSQKHQPTLTEPKSVSQITNRKKLLKPECVRSYVKCCDEGCDKLRCVYSLGALDVGIVDQFVTAAQDVKYMCGSQPLPGGHVLCTGEKPIIVDDQLSHVAAMEINYYHNSRPKALTPKRDEWPVLCYHCGSSDGAAVDQEMVASDEHAMVLPICIVCSGKGKKVKTTNPAKSGTKQCSAPSGKSAQLMRQNWCTHRGRLRKRKSLNECW